MRYIAFNMILDYCLTESQESHSKANHFDKNEEVDETSRLNKYQFNKHDVEDLTRIQGDFKTVLPNVTCTNEVQNSDIERLLKVKENTNSHQTLNSSLSNIDEEDGSKHSVDGIYHADDGNSKASEETEYKNIKEKKEISKSVDDLEFCDPRGIDVLKSINKIEESARKVEKELDYFIGGPNNIKFYEINEKLLRLMIALCDVMCETAEMQLRKTQTLEYIEACQKRLKDKATNSL
ncbi:hypothetical protein NQ314_017399 [Rhamnusium bicolor]|uniref:Uncharacterized protein n=1 Tax=Rhamnusium bicolor TaxID=1586634 RepID=A0AAV8WUF1_9CUCU|nr:hypothetical protein NQ314_017399 [Rhamnusium bicolor]